jgi:hypothetical protein
MESTPHMVRVNLLLEAEIGKSNSLSKQTQRSLRLMIKTGVSKAKPKIQRAERY